MSTLLSRANYKTAAYEKFHDILRSEMETVHRLLPLTSIYISEVRTRVEKSGAKDGGN